MFLLACQPRRDLIYLWIFASIFLLQSNAADSSSWLRRGPGGGSFTSIVFSRLAPGNVLLNNNEIYRSRDAGKSWKPLTISGEVPTDSQGRIRSDSFSGRILIYNGCCFYESDDGAVSFHKISDISEFSVDDFAYQPLNPRTIFLIGDRGSGYSQGRRLFRSTDGGSTWESQANKGIESVSGPVSMAVATSGIRTSIYAIFGERTVYKTTDQGAKWTMANAGIRDRLIGLIIDPKNPHVVYSFGKAGLFKTVDGGTNWFIIKNGYVSSLSIDPLNPSNLFAVGPRDSGESQALAAKSTDGGATWMVLSLPQALSYLSVAIHPLNPRIIMVTARDRGVFLSLDGGLSWQEANRGLDSLDVRQVFAVGSHWVARSPLALFQSLDSGRTWKANLTGGLLGQIDNLIVHPLYPNYMIAEGCCPNVIATSDGGNTWLRLNVPDQGDIRFHPKDPRTFYIVSPSSGVKTTDGGKSWTRLGLRGLDINVFELSNSSPEVLWIGTLSGSIYKSTDSGKSWTKVSDSLTTWRVEQISVNPRNANIAYLVTTKGNSIEGYRPALFKTYNGGHTWTLLNEQIDNVVIDSTNPQSLFSTNGTRLLYSQDAGATWKAFPSEGLPRSRSFGIYSVAFNVSSDLIVAATNEGVFSRTRR